MKNMKKNILKGISLLLLVLVCMGMIKNESHAAVTIESDNYYYICFAKNQNYCLDVKNGSTSNNANIRLYKKSNGNDAQLWKIVKKNGYWTITNKGSKKCINLYGGKSGKGTNIVQYKANNTNAQKFTIVSSGNRVRFKTYYGKYIDVDNGVAKNKTNVHVWSSNKANQQFVLIPYVNYTYKTVTLKSFTTLDQWKKSIADANASVTPLPSLVYTANGKMYNKGDIIVNIEVLGYKRIPTYYYNMGEKKTLYVNLPSKLRYKLHKHNISQKVWFDFSYLSLTQTCECGYRNNIQWEVPYPETEYMNGYYAGKSLQGRPVIYSNSSTY